MSEVKRYRATIGNGSSQRREWVYLCSDVESPKHEKFFKTVSANAVDELTSAKSELAALREELARVKQQSALRLIGLATCGMKREATEQRLAAAEQRNADDQRDAERYRKLRKVTPYRFKKMQDASVTDGGDVLYFHADRFDALMDVELTKPTESGASE